MVGRIIPFRAALLFRVPPASNVGFRPGPSLCDRRPREFKKSRESPRGVEVTWLRGRDLNPGPLGYENFFAVCAERKNP